MQNLLICLIVGSNLRAQLLCSLSRSWGICAGNCEDSPPFFCLEVMVIRGLFALDNDVRKIGS